MDQGRDCGDEVKSDVGSIRHSERVLCASQEQVGSGQGFPSIRHLVPIQILPSL